MERVLNVCSPNKGTVKPIKKKLAALKEKLSVKSPANIVENVAHLFQKLMYQILVKIC